jgi:hypothetical protein
MKKTNSLFSNYLHEYAIWTSARAVQRGFTTTKNIKIAIEQSGIEEFAKEFRNSTIDQSLFDNKHIELVKSLIESFHSLSKTKETEKAAFNIEKVTYGRMAKIIAIYLKTSVVIPNQGKGELAKITHPPIDAIFLKALHDKIAGRISFCRNKLRCTF